MARPLTKGPAIGLRLPLEVHEAYAERASAKGLTIGAYVESVLVATLAATTKVARSKTGGVCAHDVTRFTGTMTICSTCGAVKGSGGTWRNSQ